MSTGPSSSERRRTSPHSTFRSSASSEAETAVAGTSASRRVWSGIAVFVAAVWIVTSVGSLDRSETSVVPGGNVTGRVKPGPADGVTGLPGPYAGLRSCSDGAKVGLDLALGGGGFAVLLEIHRSPIGDKWRIKMWHDGRLFYAKTKVASDSGDVIANPLSNRGQHPDSVRAHAVDTSTGEICIARATT